MGGSKIRDTILGGPHNNDYSILGSILGFPYSGKLPYNDVRNHNSYSSNNNNKVLPEWKSKWRSTWEIEWKLRAYREMWRLGFRVQGLGFRV